MGLIEPQATWATVILIAGLGFLNYILWKIYGPRGVDIGSFLGGLVNSTATVAELSHRVKESDGTLLAVVYRGAILATAAMLIRNSLLLAILAWPALVSSLIPMAMMISGSVVFVWRSLKDRLAEAQAPKLNLEQPFSLTAALRFGLIFLALQPRTMKFHFKSQPTALITLI